MGTWNPVTCNLQPYPMEALNALKARLKAEGKVVFDFGTGDPKLPLWESINERLVGALEVTTSYPSIAGSTTLRAAHLAYLNRRFSLSKSQLEGLDVLPTRGSKEAIFHMALSLVGRLGRRSIAYPVPGYPVYASSVSFAGGNPVPILLNESNSFELRPWELPLEQQRDLAAVWINYPHNPSGALASSSYLSRLVDWAEKMKVVLLSDECYVDLYRQSVEERPKSLLEYRTEDCFVFHSLSKRSGLTGYRCGFLAGDKQAMSQLKRARANFGLGQPAFLQSAAEVAWENDEHVALRRAVFEQRVDEFCRVFENTPFITSKPLAGFYVPVKTDLPAEVLCSHLGQAGVIATPMVWLGDEDDKTIRFALAVEKEAYPEVLKRCLEVYSSLKT